MDSQTRKLLEHIHVLEAFRPHVQHNPQLSTQLEDAITSLQRVLVTEDRPSCEHSTLDLTTD